jgi:CubicO group peptidase (beta-lactamase class C family)
MAGPVKPVAPETEGFDPARLDRISAWMERYISQGKYAGSSILIARNGHQVYHHAAGLRDLEAGLPFEPDTVVRLYSMTKPVTSVAIMMLLERAGNIRWRLVCWAGWWNWYWANL